MECLKSPFKAIIEDFKGRWACLKSDWVDAFAFGPRILAPTTILFFASFLPVVAFGEQFSQETDGVMGTIEALTSTAICGIIHSLIGGQPLLILGIAEPTVMLYTYMYNFVKDKPDVGKKLYLAWAGWACFWTAVMLLLLAIFNASKMINRLTRFTGEPFSMLITILVFQEAVQPSAAEVLKDLKEAVIKREDEGDKTKNFIPEKHIGENLPVRVNEQRLTNFVQSLLVGAVLFAMPIINKMPSSVLWGYFAYMAIDSLTGNQLWERILLLLVPSTRRYKVLEAPHPSYVETVPYKNIAKFTLIQLTYLFICFGITWIPIAGMLFPLLFYLLILVRQYVLPKFLDAFQLHELDAADYEEIEGAPKRRKYPLSDMQEDDSDDDDESRSCNSEILDEITTRRGELKHRSKSLRDENFLKQLRTRSERNAEVAGEMSRV